MVAALLACFVTVVVLVPIVIAVFKLDHRYQ